ncbi:hypothetical protein [Citricoccus sp. GCM10030269]|uniref:hypothetical protein n=1 Tax=Citricoccus sp. GCM10030269 TaxID=3273388 RepID=UPI00361FB5B0
MTTDSDSPRKNDDELTEESIEEINFHRTPDLPPAGAVVSLDAIGDLMGNPANQP